MYQPDVQSGQLRKTFTFQRHTAKLFSDMTATGPITYIYVMVVLPHGSADPTLFVALEESAISKMLGTPPMLCTFHEQKHVNHGGAAGLRDIEQFCERACEIVCEVFGESLRG